MGGDSEVENLPSSVADHEPDVKQMKLNGGDDYEVHCGDPVFVISEKGLPSLALIVVGTSLR